MKILFIGGTGNISTSVSRRVIEQGHELHLLTRGKRESAVAGGIPIMADIRDEAAVATMLRGLHFDVVANFVGFTIDDVERDIRLFSGKCNQYIFISSGSVYQKPLSHPIVTESTPLANPYWQFARDKIACELRLMAAYRDIGFPVTIIRPSLTYDKVIPVAIGSWEDYTIVQRIRDERPIISHGDGSSLWTITHAGDFAVGMTGLLGHQQAIGESFHICSDEILTWDQIYQAVAAAAGRPAQIIHIPSDFICKIVPSWTGPLCGDKSVSMIMDNSKIKRFVPEFKATTRFNVGIRHTIEWFEAKKQRMRIDPEVNRLMDLVIAKYLTAYGTL
jgi:nucleoside-diphosphate-sugar epimerase